MHFKEWCDKLDTDGDRHIEVEELASFMDGDGTMYVLLVHIYIYIYVRHHGVVGRLLRLFTHTLAHIHAYISHRCSGFHQSCRYKPRREFKFCRDGSECKCQCVHVCNEASGWTHVCSHMLLLHTTCIMHRGGMFIISEVPVTIYLW